MASIKDKELLPTDYSPSAKEEYMNPRMLAYFKNKLIEWKNELIKQLASIHQSIIDHTEKVSDFMDEAVTEETRANDFFIIERNEKLIARMDIALNKIENGEYGYCEKTGEIIGIERLKAWPIAIYTVEIQEALEKRP